MIELRTIIQNQLESIHPRVYFQAAPKKATFPYLVFSILDISDDGEGFQLALVDVDGWDSPALQDSTSLEILMKAVNIALNKKTFTSGNTTVVFYLDKKIPLTDEDTLIKRRKYTYQGRLFERS